MEVSMSIGHYSERFEDCYGWIIIVRGESMFKDFVDYPYPRIHILTNVF